KLHNRIAGCTLGDLDRDAGMGFPILTDKFREKAAGDQGMDTDAKPAALSGCRHSGGLYRMIELVDASRYPFDEVSPGFSEPDAACVTLEQEDAKVFFQRFHSRTDAGLRHAERISGVAEVQIFGDGKCIDQRYHGNA